MHTLSSQRCYNHAVREAVARCPECRRFFCRECVTEHEDQILCANCLKKRVRLPLRERAGFVGVLRSLQLVTAFLLAWFFFYLVAAGLARLPSDFHEGTLWEAPFMESE